MYKTDISSLGRGAARRLTTGTAASLALLLAACGSEDPPGATTTTTSTSGPTGSGGSSSGSGGSSSTGEAGGGSGGTGGSSTSTSGGGDYYPLADGSEWVYQHTTADGEDWVETITVSSDGDDFIQASSVDPFDLERSDSVLKIIDGVIYRTTKDTYSVDGNGDEMLNFSVTYDPGFVRFDPAWLTMAIGQKVTYDYVRTETNAEASQPDPPQDRSHIFEVLDVEADCQFDGEPHKCLQIRRTRDYVSTSGDPEDQSKTYWFAPDIGKVKELSDNQNNEDLTSYTP